MREGIRLHSPALAISLLALFAALGGTVYAAKKAKINGRAIIVKSLPGDRLKLRSVPANRLKPHSVTADQLQPGALSQAVLPTPLTGADINELTLGQVPSAARAEAADSAQRAVEAETAINAVNAVNAETVNGHSAGCLPNTQPFAGACWQTSQSGSAATAPEAAADCAAQGGTLPEALQLAAFAKRPGVNLDAGDEWSGEIVSFTDVNVYGVATVSPAGAVKSAVYSGGVLSEKRHYRCVIPLLR
jgi:hypothetical protein